VPKITMLRAMAEDCRTALFQRIHLENSTWIEGLRIVIVVLIQIPTTKAHHAGTPSIEG